MIMALAKINQHVVATRGVESVVIAIPKTLRCRAIVRLAQLRDGWRFGYDYAYSLGGGGCAPSRNHDVFPSRDAALHAGLATIRRQFVDAAGYHKHEINAARAARRALALIDQFTAQKFPTKKEATMSTATLEKSNGHKKATKTKHAASPGRTRKEAKPFKNLPIDSSGKHSPGDAAFDSKRNIPPGATSTTTPGGAMRNDPDADGSTTEQRRPRWAVPEAAAVTGQEIECDLALLHRHPDNRRSSDDDGDVHSLAESIRADGQIQAITVRIAPPHWDLQDGHYQIVCGERRWRACRVAGRGSVRCKVRADLDDAATLRIIAAENALRRDLNPIEKAHLVERLCSENADGSKALTRDQAAQVIGLESGGAASNIARLLSLPDVWQKRVASGELAWSWAQEIYPYLQAEPVMDQLEQAWRHGDRVFESRKELARSLGAFTLTFCRRLDSAEFDAADRSEQEVLDELECVELPDPEALGSKRKTAVFATNVKRFHELQQQAQAEQSKAKASKVGQDEPPKKAAGDRQPTKAELREAAEERARKLAGEINVWRHKLLRHEIARAMEEGRDDGWRLVMCYAAYVNTIGPRFCELLQRATNSWPKADWSHGWPCVANVRTEAARRNVTHAMALLILRGEPSGLDFETVGALAADLGVDVAGAWLWLQAAAVPDRAARQAMLQEFLLLHRTDELKDLGAELGVHFMAGTTTKEGMIKLILSKPRLPVPKSIKPLKAAKAEGKKRKKGKAAK